MKNIVWKSVKSGLAAVLIVFSTAAAPLSMVSAAAAANNGTLKVHEIGTPSGTESNDPKVCAFNFEGFSFDPSQSGYINIETQGGSAPIGVNAGPFSFGPTDGTGYAISEDFNTLGGTAIADGTYKATLYGKDAGGAVNLTDVKAKSKVFKVECAPVTTPVTPADVTFVDLCGVLNDTYTIPATTGVFYQIAGITVAAGTYPGSGTVVITALADTNYSLTGTINWTHTFTDEACTTPPVTPSAPTGTDLTCDDDGFYTIPSTTGVTYKVNGTVTAAGTYPVITAGSITVTAEVVDGYTLTGTTSWTLAFTEPDDCEIPVIDVCPNIEGIQTHIPVGMVLDNHTGKCIIPGRGGGGTDTIVLSSVTTSTPLPASTTPSPQAAVTTPHVKELVNTGNTALISLFTGIFIIGATAATSLVNRKSRA